MRREQTFHQQAAAGLRTFRDRRIVEAAFLVGQQSLSDQGAGLQVDVAAAGGQRGRLALRQMGRVDIQDPPRPGRSMGRP